MKHMLRMVLDYITVHQIVLNHALLKMYCP